MHNTGNVDRRRPYLWDRGSAARPVGWDRAVVASAGDIRGGSAKRSPEIHLDQPRSLTGAPAVKKRHKRHSAMADQMRANIARLAGTPLPATGAGKSAKKR